VHNRRAHRLSSIAIVLLSSVALLVVVWGYSQPPARDEGTGAHIFQLSIVTMLPMMVLFLTTADWQRPWRTARPLAVAVAATVLAFGALYYLEHFR
jgi:hypothetical protein